MKYTALVLLAGVGLAGCQVGTEDVENSIRASLSNQVTVDEVNMTKEADGNMTGYANVRDSAGLKGRMKCQAHPDAKDKSKYSWKCEPVIDADTEKQVQDQMRAELVKSGEVLEVVMKRKDDDNHMAGNVRLRTPDGVEHSLTCSAARDPSGKMAWSCEEVGAAQPAATGEASDEGEAEGQ